MKSLFLASFLPPERGNTPSQHSQRAPCTSGNLTALLGLGFGILIFPCLIFSNVAGLRSQALRKALRQYAIKARPVFQGELGQFQSLSHSFGVPLLGRPVLPATVIPNV